MATLYDGLGAKQGLVVTIPGGTPTGQVSNPTNDFVLPVGGKALFLFATFGGSIEGWIGGHRFADSHHDKRRDHENRHDHAQADDHPCLGGKPRAQTCHGSP